MLALMSVGLVLMFWGLCMADEDVGFATQLFGAFLGLLGVIFV